MKTSKLDYQNSYKSDRTRLGNFFYDMTMHGSIFLMKHMWLYYVLNLTWGIIYTLIGFVMFTFMVPFTFLFRKHFRPQIGRFAKAYYLQEGHNWGGLEGVFFFFVANDMGEYWTLHTKQHEFGHSFQNALYGPFNIFLTLIPSVCRYWYQTIRDKKGLSNKPYDLAWFEGSASETGKYYYTHYMKDCL